VITSSIVYNFQVYEWYVTLSKERNWKVGFTISFEFEIYLNLILWLLNGISHALIKMIVDWG